MLRRCVLSPPPPSERQNFMIKIVEQYIVLLPYVNEISYFKIFVDQSSNTNETLLSVYDSLYLT